MKNETINEKPYIFICKVCKKEIATYYKYADTCRDCFDKTWNKTRNTGIIARYRNLRNRIINGD